LVERPQILAPDKGQLLLLDKDYDPCLPLKPGPRTPGSNYDFGNHGDHYHTKKKKKPQKKDKDEKDEN
jgi:hypothetical protein